MYDVNNVIIQSLCNGGKKLKFYTSVFYQVLKFNELMEKIRDGVTYLNFNLVGLCHFRKNSYLCTFDA